MYGRILGIIWCTLKDKFKWATISAVFVQNDNVFEHRRQGVFVNEKPHSVALASDCLTGFLIVVQGWETAGQWTSMYVQLLCGLQCGMGHLTCVRNAARELALLSSRL